MGAAETQMYSVTIERRIFIGIDTVIDASLQRMLRNIIASLSQLLL